MKVLFVAGACPFPPDSGGTVRTYNILKRLCLRHQVTLICPAKHGVDLESVFGGNLRRVIVVGSPRRNVTQTLASFLSPLPYIAKAHANPAMNAAVREALSSESFDLLHCDSISVVQAIPPEAPIPKVFNAHNVEAMIWERYVCEEQGPWVVPVLRSQLRKVASYEAASLRTFDRCAVVSDDDREQMKHRYGVENATVVANGVDLDFYKPLQDTDAPNIVFIGSLDWRPNQDAVRWLLESIWPLIKAEKPEACLSLIGRRPPQWTADSCDRTHASLYADVPDVRPHLADAAVVIVPLRIGGGSRLKILEAMAAGRCVVSTTIGAEGLDVRSGEHLVIADDPSDLARQTILLLGDSKRRQDLARAGRALVEAHYGWDQIALQLEQAWNSAYCDPNLSHSRRNPDDTHTSSRLQ